MHNILMGAVFVFALFCLCLGSISPTAGERIAALEVKTSRLEAGIAVLLQERKEEK